MNSADTTGIIIDSEIYCTICADEDEGDAIFAGSEYDYQPYCNECGNEIEVSLLNENEDTDSCTCTQCNLLIEDCDCHLEDEKEYCVYRIAVLHDDTWIEEGEDNDLVIATDIYNHALERGNCDGVELSVAEDGTIIKSWVKPGHISSEEC